MKLTWPNWFLVKVLLETASKYGLGFSESHTKKKKKREGTPEVAPRPSNWSMVAVSGAALDPSFIPATGHPVRKNTTGADGFYF